jgi:hypothetical protein
MQRRVVLVISLGWIKSVERDNLCDGGSREGFGAVELRHRKSRPDKIFTWEGLKDIPYLLQVQEAANEIP